MKILFSVTVVVTLGSVIAASLCAPAYLASNEFLANFINHEVLNILAVIMTVTSASGANIHLAFNRAEEVASDPTLFREARREVDYSVLWLIGLFALSVVVLIVRSYFLGNLLAVSIFNGVVLVILLVNIFVLVDLTMAIFEIHPMLNNEAAGGRADSLS